MEGHIFGTFMKKRGVKNEEPKRFLKWFKLDWSVMMMTKMK